MKQAAGRVKIHLHSQIEYLIVKYRGEKAKEEKNKIITCLGLVSSRLL